MLILSHLLILAAVNLECKVVSSFFKQSISFENCWMFAGVLDKNFYHPPNYITPKYTVRNKNKNNKHCFIIFIFSVVIYVCCSGKYHAAID